MTDMPFLDTLRTDLVAGIAARRRRHHRWVATLAASVLLAATASALIGLPGGSRDALAIEHRGDWIELRIADADASAGEMTAELDDAGIDGEVRSVAVARELVGRWACVAEVPLGQDPRTALRLNELDYERTLVRVRRDFAERPHEGRFVLLAGREPRSGERAATDPCSELFKRG